jgi:hypothetical protein
MQLIKAINVEGLSCMTKVHCYVDNIEKFVSVLSYAYKILFERRHERISHQVRLIVQISIVKVFFSYFAWNFLLTLYYPRCVSIIPCLGIDASMVVVGFRDTATIGNAYGLCYLILSSTRVALLFVFISML